MLSLARNGYTAAEVREQLHSLQGARTLTFRYELLNASNQLVQAELDNVLSCEVTYQRDADIKRTAKLQLVDDGSVDYLSQRIRPVARLAMPDGGWAEWRMGVFLLSSPRRQAQETGSVLRDVDAYDQLQVYADDKITNRYSVPAGDLYTDAVVDLLGAGVSVNLVRSTKTLITTMEWEIGTTKLKIINDLLASINYDPLIFDESGRAVIRPYRTPATRPSEYEYRDDDESVILPGVEQSLDLYGVPNTWVLIVSDPDRPPLTSTYVNDNPDSPTSTVSRGRSITDVLDEQDAPDQATLDALAARAAFEASQVYDEVTFTTGLMPHHGHDDVVTLTYSKLGLSARYSEAGWSVRLASGERMRHTVRRLVPVG